MVLNRGESDPTALQHFESKLVTFVNMAGELQARHQMMMLSADD